MEKKIEDYLHLYPKVPIAICEPGVEPVGHYLEGCDWYLNKAIAERVNYDPSWIKPILRPLSDMTEEDVSEWSDVTVTNTPYCVELDSKDEFGEFTMVYPDGSILSKSKDDGDIRPINGGHLFRLLLSKHFDLFGLIEAGLAINSTTTKKTSKRWAKCKKCGMRVERKDINNP